MKQEPPARRNIQLWDDCVVLDPSVASSHNEAFSWSVLGVLSFPFPLVWILNRALNVSFRFDDGNCFSYSPFCAVVTLTF